MRVGQLFAVLLGGAVVVVALAAGWSWLTTDLVADPQSSADPDATVEAYLERWRDGDHLAMVELVREPPDDFVARHDQLRSGLRVHTLDLVAGIPREPVDGRLVYPVAVTALVGDSQASVAWDTEVSIVRERGEWSVEFDLTTLHPQLRTSWRFDIESESVGRASILATDGRQLAGGGTTVRFGFEPNAVSDPDAVATAFERAVSGSGAAAERELSRGDLVDGWFYPVVDVHERRADAVWQRLRGTPGVLRRPVTERTLHDIGFARHVVGVIAEATAEQLEQLGDAGERGMLLPQFGLERELDDRLTGSDLVRAGLREGEDGPMRVVIAESQADPSGPVTTTIDIDVQQAVEDALDGVDRPVGVVVVDARDSAVRAAASRPLSGYNRAFQGRYAPGSTFKIVTAEALLAAGADATDVVGCPAATTVGGLRVPNAGDRALGEISLGEAFAESCNTTLAALGAGLGADALVEAAARFGFGTEPSVVLDAYSGAFPVPRDTAEAGAASFGQARVEASALHMATVMGAAVTGAWHPPYLLEDDGPFDPRPLTSGASDQLHAMLRTAVESGTGTGARIAGLEILGKTGTAQASGGVEHAWFVGAFDGLAFAIIVEGGGAGGDVAAPIARRLVAGIAGLASDPGIEERTDG